jgi:hypothetical protein
MKLNSRSYPHPVVGNRDDVPGAAFQASLEMTSDKEAVYLDAAIKCSSKTINDLIKKGDATFVLHVECSNTLFRRAFEFRDVNHRIQIPADNLNDAVEVNVFARAIRDLSGYKVDMAHSDYGKVLFDVEKGDIVAVGEGQVFYVESNFDSLSPIGSIMQIQEGQDDGDIPMRAEFNADKIQIVLSKKEFADYKLLKSMEGISVALTTAIVLPVLIEAIHILKEEPEEEDRRWIRALRRRMEVLDLKITGEPLEMAQLLLELPVKRTLISARMLAEGAA